MTGEILVNLDTRALERKVLEGGPKTLARAKGVLIELPSIRLYAGGRRFQETVEFTSSLNSVPTQLDKVNYPSTSKMALVEVDCLFRPRDSWIDRQRPPPAPGPTLVAHGVARTFAGSEP